MSVNLILVGTSASYAHFEDVLEPVWSDESLGWYRHHFVLEQDLEFISFLLGVDGRNVFDLFQSQLRNLSEEIDNYDNLPQMLQEQASKQELVDKLEKNWKGLQNNVTDVLDTIAELKSKLIGEMEKLAELSDSPVIFPPDDPYELKLSPKKSYKRLQELGVIEALDELSEAVKSLSGQGVKTVWLEEI